jgi:hypothetical protein
MEESRKENETKQGILKTFAKAEKWLYTHAGCIIALMLIFLGWYIAFTCAGKASEIASWTSILLATVVVVFMIIQHALFDAKIEKIESRITSYIPQKIEEQHRLTRDAIGRNIVVKSGGLARREQQIVTHQNVRFDISELRLIELLCVYCLAKSYKEKKRFIGWNVMERIYKGPQWTREHMLFGLGSLFGMVNILQCILPKESITDCGTVIGEVEFESRRFAEGLADAIRTQVTARLGRLDPKSSEAALLNNGLSAIDDYFSAKKGEQAEGEK